MLLPAGLDVTPLAGASGFVFGASVSVTDSICSSAAVSSTPELVFGSVEGTVAGLAAGAGVVAVAGVGETVAGDATGAAVDGAGEAAGAAVSAMEDDEGVSEPGFASTMLASLEICVSSSSFSFAASLFAKRSLALPDEARPARAV